MKRVSMVLILLILVTLTACALEKQFTVPPESTPVPGTDSSGQVATVVAEILTQTAASAIFTPVPVPTFSPVVSTTQQTFQGATSGELIPADSDTPASGICGAAQGDPVAIVLGVGPDGLPLAGRCIAVQPTQRIKLINQSNGPLSIKFANYSIDLPVGKEMLLDKPTGEYLAVGVHFIPMGPELWVKPLKGGGIPATSIPGGVQNYTHPEAGFTVTLPLGWNVDESGLSGPNKEVVFSPGSAEPSVTYLSIRLDSRTLEQIVNDYAQNFPDAAKEDTIFNGLQAIKFTYSSGRAEYFLTYGNQTILIATDKPLDGDVQLVLMSIRFP